MEMIADDNKVVNGKVKAVTLRNCRADDVIMGIERLYGSSGTKAGRFGGSGVRG